MDTLRVRAQPLVQDSVRCAWRLSQKSEVTRNAIHKHISLAKAEKSSLLKKQQNMGLLQSIFCSFVFCIERVLTWTCCAFLLMLMMFVIIVLMVYGISVGYHYAQKELASFALTSRTTTEPSIMRRSGGDDRPVVRLVAVNRSEERYAPEPLVEIYRTKRPDENVYLETSGTPVVLLETERSPKESELSQREKELTRRLIGRFRRSRNITSTSIPFLRPLNSSEPPLPAAA